MRVCGNVESLVDEKLDEEEEVLDERYLFAVEVSNSSSNSVIGANCCCSMFEFFREGSLLIKSLTSGSPHAATR